MYLLWRLEKLLKEYSQSTSTEKVEVDFSSILRDEFILKYPEGNCSFAEPNDKVFVPSIIEGDVEDVVVGTETVFIDFSENLRCFGLEKFVCGKTASGIPVFVCDNHNFVLEAWELLKHKRPTLIHIDQHRDEAKCLCEKGDSIRQTRVCDYIDYALKNEWIQEKFYSFVQSGDLDQLEQLPQINKIANIDIDIFEPECTVLSLEEKVKIITEATNGASLITIATSPGFIAPELSVKIAKLLWQYL